jgi:spermidine/putrescine transport system ATP-binding protein
MQDPYEVQLIEISKHFSKLAAVDHVSLDIKRGEFLTLLGPSGCGKTTLLRIIAGFEFPDRGRVILGGEDVTDVPPFRRDVTTVFQQYALFPHLNVFENVAFGLERRHLDKPEITSRVGTALELVQLRGLEYRRPSSLSGGQQQRVALARALVVEPRILLLDEPLAALDLKLRRQMQIELKRLQRQVGISFVFVTHDQEEALTMSDRVAVMNSGKLEQLGPAEEIYESPKTEFVAGFIGTSNIIEATVVGSENGCSVIRLGSSNVLISGNQSVVGEPVKVMIRPEKIRLGSDVTAGQLQGVITSAVYLGESTQLKVTLDGGPEVMVLEQNRDVSQSSRINVGKPVSVSWDPESAVILKS